MKLRASFALSEGKYFRTFGSVRSNFSMPSSNDEPSSCHARHPVHYRKPIRGRTPASRFDNTLTHCYNSPANATPLQLLLNALPIRNAHRRLGFLVSQEHRCFELTQQNDTSGELSLGLRPIDNSPTEKTSTRSFYDSPQGPKSRHGRHGDFSQHSLAPHPGSPFLAMGTPLLQIVTKIDPGSRFTSTE